MTANSTDHHTRSVGLVAVKLWIRTEHFLKRVAVKNYFPPPPAGIGRRFRMTTVGAVVSLSEGTRVGRVSGPDRRAPVSS